MLEWRPTDSELDALIESALRDEPLAPVPRDLHGRITARVQLAALEQKERARFRNALLSGFAGAVGTVAMAVALLALTNFNVLLNHGVSGGLGFLDYYTATFELPWPIRPDGLVLAACIALGGLTIWAGLRPLRQGGIFHHYHTVRGQGAMHDHLLRTR